MGRRTTKAIVILLIIFLMLSLASFAFAASSEDFNYDTLSNGSVRITKYTGSASSITIPETIDGKTVTAIGERAFRYAKITSIVIPGSISDIGLKAFLACESLKSVVFQESDGSLDIGDYAFDGNTSLVTVDIGAKNINLHERAFRYCSALQAINFTNNLQGLSIGEKTFLSCTELVDFKVPDTVPLLHIGAYAFDGASALQKVHLSGETIILDERAFRYCDSIKEVTFAENVKAIRIGENAFLGCTGLVNFLVPEAVTDFSVGAYAFDGNSSLSALTYGSANVSLGERAFRYCESLERILIPNGTISIGENAFLGCNKLTIYAASVGSAEQYARDNRISFADASTYIPVSVKTFDVSIPSVTEMAQDSETAVPTAVSSQDWICPNCGNSASGNFCNNCGTPCPIDVVPTSAPTVATTTVPAATPQLAAAAPLEEGVRQLSSGKYTVGVDIPAGTYHFWKIRGDQYTAVLYVFNSDNLDDEVASGSADETGCVLNLKVGQILRITWTGANAVIFNTSWAENEEKTLPSGSYIIGEDIAEGTYRFWKIEGDKYTSILHVFNAGDPDNEVASGSADEAGCVLNLKEGQILRLTWTAANAARFNTVWSDGEEKMLPSGSYTVGQDIPVGTYHFWKIDGDKYTAILYVYNSNDLENEVVLGSADEKGCVLNLKEGQILKLTWTGVNAASFNTEWHEGEIKKLPSGSYVVGDDIPAGRYTFRKIDEDSYTAVLYVYNANDLENEIDSGSANQRGYVVTLLNGQVLRITWTGVNASVENMSLLNTESDSARALSSSVVNTSPKPTASQVSSTKEPFSAPSKAPSSFSEETVKVKLSSGREITARKSIIEALDAYEAFMDDYKDAMTKMGDGDFTGYMTFMTQHEELMEKVGVLEDDLTEDESWYYYEVSLRVLEKID